jgi:bifunctional UDP-N-acetylglucosamine pyrophosphorylase/glucosamine-1-phosphate N-acetyltransferase
MQAVILAAGASSRFWPLNTRHKSLMTVRGKTLLEHTIDGLRQQDITDIIIVQGPNSTIEQHITPPDDTAIRFVTQPEPRGMGNALEQAREQIDETFVVTGPYRFDIDKLLDRMASADASYDGAVIGARTERPERYGILDIDEQGVAATGIVEKPATGEAPSSYKIVSTYLLNPMFFDYLDAVDEHEYSFEDALDRYMADRTVAFTELETEPPSLKYPWDLFDVAETLLNRQERRIADSAEIAESAMIDGNVVIGENTRIYENAVIRGPCYIGADCTIGNNAVVRSYSNVADGCTIGTNMELRGSILQDRTSTHSGFIGDSIIGRDASIGAGAVTANRMVRDADGERPTVSVYVQSKEATVDTGRSRLGMIVGDRADIGTQANIMPGVCIGAGTFIGPSTFVKHNIGEAKRYFTTMDGRELDRRRDGG